MNINTESNREEFINLLKSVVRPGAKIDELITKLNASDFFRAPASIKYHGAYEGGLCDHCLCVYHNLLSLVESKQLRNEIDINSIIICGLLHDIAKMNYYKKDYRNKKVYSESGSKTDNGGRFDWVVEETYSTIPTEERFIYGNHEETSEYMIRQYIPLTYEESAAILSHMGGLSYDSKTSNTSIIYDRYSLACLLHIADLLASYVDKA